MPTPYCNCRYRLTLWFNNQILLQFQNSNVNQNIDFSCTLTKDAFGNGNARGSLFIYNLAPEKRNTLEALISQAKASSMQFSIEYSPVSGEDQYQLLSYDDVIGLYNELGEEDYKTNLVLKSGEGSLTKTYTSAGFEPGAKLSTILSSQGQNLIDGIGIKNIAISSTLQEQTYPYGCAFSGNTFANLSKLCSESNNTVFVDQGVLYALPAAWSNGGSNQQDLNFYNGLLEPPHLGQNNFQHKYNPKQSSISFQFKALLMPAIKINAVISVLNQLYTVKRISHVIQSREGIAYSTIEGYQNASL